MMYLQHIHHQQQLAIQQRSSRRRQMKIIIITPGLGQLTNLHFDATMTAFEQISDVIAFQNVIVHSTVH